jgi:hypothetical protein
MSADKSTTACTLREYTADQIKHEDSAPAKFYERLTETYQNEDQHYQNEDQIIHVQTPLYSATVQTSLRLGVFLLSFLVFRC